MCFSRPFSQSNNNKHCIDVLHAWRKSKDPSAPDRCEALLAEMYELGDPNSTLPHCKPDTFAVTVRPRNRFWHLILLY